MGLSHCISLLHLTSMGSTDAIGFSAIHLERIDGYLAALFISTVYEGVAIPWKGIVRQRRRCTPRFIK